MDTRLWLDVLDLAASAALVVIAWRLYQSRK